MTFYLYYPKENQQFRLIGSGKGQIITALETLNKNKPADGLEFVLPDLDKILEKESVGIFVAAPMLQRDQYIDAQVAEGVTMHVNANAFEHVTGYATKIRQNPDKYQLGGMYLLESKPYGIPRPILLTREIVDGITDYDWNQHEPQVTSWLEQREDSLQRLENLGALARVR